MPLAFLNLPVPPIMALPVPAAPVIWVTATPLGVEGVMLGDHIVTWEDGRVTLQREVDVEVFLTLARALERLPETVSP